MWGRSTHVTLGLTVGDAILGHFLQPFPQNPGKKGKINPSTASCLSTPPLIHLQVGVLSTAFLSLLLLPHTAQSLRVPLSATFEPGELGGWWNPTALCSPEHMELLGGVSGVSYGVELSMALRGVKLIWGFSAFPMAKLHTTWEESISSKPFWGLECILIK